MKVHGFKAKRCRVKEGYEEAGKGGWCYGYINLVQSWGIVQWDGEPDPSLHKIAGLEEQTISWRDIK